VSVSLAGDLRFGARMLSRSPILSCAAALSLALGIGANVVVLSWADAFVLRPLPGVPQQDRLLFLDVKNAAGDDVKFSAPDLRDVAARATTFSSIAGQSFQAFTVGVDGGEKTRVFGQLVGGSFFEMLGQRPQLGRLLTPSDDRPEAPPVAVLGHGLWTARFGSDPSVVGRTIEIERRLFTVVGVAAPEFRSGVAGLESALFVPLARDGEVTPGGSRLEDRGKRFLSPLARLADGATLARARQELAAIGRDLARAHATNESLSMLAFTLANAPYGTQELMRPVSGVLGAVSLAMLLIACANVANLLLARGVSRRREMAVRAALGAGRARLVKQLLAEGAILAAVGGLAGTFAGVSAARVFPALVPPTRLPITAPMRVDFPLLLGAAALTFAAGLLLSVGPALAATKTRLAETLKEESGTAAGGGRTARVRRGLVVAEIALSLVLLVCAGLLLKGLAAARRLDPGFDPNGVLLVSVDLGPAGDDAKRASALEDLRTRLETLPGVAAASAARFVPLQLGAFPQVDVELEGVPVRKGEERRAGYNAVSTRFLETMRTRLVSGRDLAPADRADAAAVAVVNETFEKRWLSGSALGKRFRANGTWFTVVGVAQDGKYDSLAEAPRPYAYLPLAQAPARSEAILYVRGSGDLRALADSVRAEVHRAAPALPLFDVTTLRDRMGAPVFMYRLAGTMLSVFASLALFLAVVGLYGVVAYGVLERRREIAVRMALGARPASVVSLVIGQGLALAGVGVLAGLVLALAATRLLGKLLFGVSPADPATYAAVAALLVLVALASSFFPARQASRVNPATAFRS
jgi:predicted permease